MEILQQPISPKLSNAMFFEGVVAKHNLYTLETIQSGEILLMGNIFIGAQIITLGQANLIDDSDFEENTIDILVDKFIAIMFNDRLVDEDLYIYDNYNDAIAGFKELLNIE